MPVLIRLPPPPPAFARSEPEAKAAATKPAGEVGLDFGISLQATARHAMGFYYVYILRSKKHSDHYYAGFTGDLEARLKAHNAGQVPHTSKYRPWTIKTAIAFSDRQQALDFETYLKTPSGRAFAKKRL